VSSKRPTGGEPGTEQAAGAVATLAKVMTALPETLKAPTPEWAPPKHGFHITVTSLRPQAPGRPQDAQPRRNPFGRKRWRPGEASTERPAAEGLPDSRPANNIARCSPPFWGSARRSFPFPGRR